MNVSRPTPRRRRGPALIAALSMATLVCGWLAPGAVADPSDSAKKQSSIAAKAARATAVEKKLGAAGAGVYVDSAGRAVVNVTNAAAAAKVRASGATARIVAHSDARLAKVTSRLEAKTDVPGTAWAVDPVSNRVVVSLDESVSRAAARRITSTVRGFGSAVTVERVSGRFSTKIVGGQAILGATGGRCSLGFNVRSGSTYYFLTAGHCTDAISRWYTSGGTYLGANAGSSFPGNDYGIVRLQNGYQPGRVSLYGSGDQDITGARTPSVGEQVRRSGSTTGVRSGRVTGLNATVNYAEGQVSGLIRTTVCAEPGDSGGSLFAGTSALGMTSGGNGNCRSGGTTFFQPVTEALSAYGVQVF